ncbi:hypothetical protein GYA49_03250 [Candidatus Beckwithbacteria bacterium]|nr:hypothetical protein [Candidatus Beckwithbacteria bacterium]
MSVLKRYFILLVGAVLLASCSLPGAGKQGNNGNQAGAGNQAGKGNPFSGSLKAAMELGVPIKCSSSVDTDDGQGQVDGIIQGNQYAGIMTMNGQKANVLLTDNCMWSWKEGDTSGIKMCFEPAEGSEDDNTPFGNIDPNQLNENVNCMPTVISPSTFTPPSNISFIDVDDAMNGNLTPEQRQQLEQMGEDN